MIEIKMSKGEQKQRRATCKQDIRGRDERENKIATTKKTRRRRKKTLKALE
jgi:hypothetical protein